LPLRLTAGIVEGTVRLGTGRPANGSATATAPVVTWGPRFAFPDNDLLPTICRLATFTVAFPEAVTAAAEVESTTTNPCPLSTSRAPLPERLSAAAPLPLST